MDTNTLFAVAMISATISLIGVIVSIFTANWLNQRSTEKLIEQLEKRFDAKFDSVEAIIGSLQNEFRAEVKRIDQRLDSIETRIGNIERQLDKVFQPVLPPK
jgi:peptidoglycan hydrolase CwlO-like protein